MRSDGCFIGLTYCIQCKREEVHQKSTLPPFPFLSHLILDLEHWKKHVHQLIYVALKHRMMIAMHYSKIKCLNARYFAKIFKSLSLKSSNQNSVTLPIKGVLQSWESVQKHHQKRAKTLPKSIINPFTKCICDLRLKAMKIKHFKT